MSRQRIASVFAISASTVLLTVAVGCAGDDAAQKSDAPATAEPEAPSAAPEATPAPAPAPEPVALQFGWPVPSRGTVTAKAHNKDVDVDVTFQLTYAAGAADEVELDFVDPKINSVKFGQPLPPPMEQLMKGQMGAAAQAMPTVVVKPDGTYVRSNEVAETIKAAIAAQTDLPEKKRAGLTMMMASPPMVAKAEKASEAQWSQWASDWDGLKLLVGETTKAEHAGTSVEVTLVKVDDGKLFLTRTATTSKEALAAEIVAGGGVMGITPPPLKDGSRTIATEATLDHATLRPLDLTIKTSTTMEFEGIEAQTESVTQTLHFEWES